MVQFVHICLDYLYAPGCLLSVLPPWGASGLLAQQLGLRRQEEAES